MFSVQLIGAPTMVLHTTVAEYDGNCWFMLDAQICTSWAANWAGLHRVVQSPTVAFKIPVESETVAPVVEKLDGARPARQ